MYILDKKKEGRGMPKFRKEIYSVIKKYIAAGALLVPAVLICLPVLLILTGSVMDSLEMKQYLLPVFGDGEGYIRWKLMPDYPTFEHYGRLLFMTPSFFVLFWNSVKLVLCILAGQLLVGVPAAWAGKTACPGSYISSARFPS